jgi:hypothetical protein
MSRSGVVEWCRSLVGEVLQGSFYVFRRGRRRRLPVMSHVKAYASGASLDEVTEDA